MTASSCIFCAISAKTIPATIIAENDHVMVINDIHPKAPTHYLIIPKKHVESLCTMDQEDLSLMTHAMQMAHTLAHHLPSPASCRLIMNNGKESGQSVFHAHIHFLSGKKFSDF
jgi:histidine triad (HIT) family protein